MKRHFSVSNLKDGRIADIIEELYSVSDTRDIYKIPEEEKLYALSSSLQLDSTEFDNLISENSPVLRTVKGHTFEVALQYIFEANGIPVREIGGDSDIDLQVNGYSLQLKTPNLGGTSEKEIEYKTHKTHGAKSEQESMEYYHRVDSFADFFVGLVSYSPLNILIIPKEKLERHPLDNDYIQSPFKVKIDNNVYLNNYSILGLDFDHGQSLNIETQSKELLPKTSRIIGIKSDIILNTILNKSNFRIWDMSIRGFAREIALKRFLNSTNAIFTDKPTTVRQERGDKSDIAIKNKNGEYKFIQVKGVSTNNCNFDIEIPIIATETQLTRGRVNNHPTQSRLYLVSDFDYLMLCLDPPISNRIGLNSRWSLFLIPTCNLKTHQTYSNRLNSIQKFTKKELISYELTIQNLSHRL